MSKNGRAVTTAPKTLVRGTACALALSLLEFGTTAHAQETTTSGGIELEEITVTGTRIKQRDDYVSPNPIVTYGQDELKNLGIVNIGDAMAQVPSNVSTFQLANTGGSAFFVGSTLANLRGLNPFFGTRTLTLVDTRRFVPTNQGGSVDLNFIPSILIDRMEVVTGGASAAYGSEAVSGVVNILMNKSLQGLKAEVDYGASGEGDGDNFHLGVAGGSEFSGGRGHFVIGGEFEKQDAITNCADARDWCARGTGIFSNGSGGGPFDPIPSPHPYTPTVAGLPQNVILSGLRRSQVSRTGVIFSQAPGGATTLQFNDAGTGLVAFNRGQNDHQTLTGITPGVVGGDGRPAYDGLGLLPELERTVVNANLSFDFTDTVTGYAEVTYGKVEALNLQSSASQNEVNLCITPDNAFIAGNTDLINAITANAGNGVFPTALNFSCFGGTTVSKDFSGVTNQRVSTDTEVKRAVFGLSGALSDTWTWDTYVTVGETTRDQIGSDYRTNHRFTMAIDSVIDPMTGQPVCRATLTGIAPIGADPSLINGCQPLNFFGLNNASPEALAYAFGNLTESNTIEQQVVAASVTGELWEGLGAGAFAAALGLEYRHEELVNDAGPLPFFPRTDFGLQYGDAFGGEVDVTEGFLELEMPLLRDTPGAELLSLNTAVRQAQYKNKGGLNTQGIEATNDMTTWKVAAVWDPLKWLRFRGSQSRDIRAAGFRELYYSQSIPAGGFFGAITNPDLPDNGPGTQRDEAVLILSGNARLEPEKADTTTVGFVLSPSGWADGMHFSADYYRITLEDGIVLGNVGNVVRDCFNGSDPSQCDFITFGPPLPGGTARSNVTEARSPYINALPYEARGVDFAWDYTMQMSKFSESAPGSLGFRLTATRAIETLVQASGGIVRDIAGQTGGDQGFLSDFAASPEWSANLVVTYLRGPLALTTQARYIGSGDLDLQSPKFGPDHPLFDVNQTNSVTSNDLPSFTTWNLSGSYDFNFGDLKKLQAFLTIDNLFDKEPPFSAGQVGGVNGVYFDSMGRMYRVGMRMEF